MGAGGVVAGSPSRCVVPPPRTPPAERPGGCGQPERACLIRKQPNYKEGSPQHTLPAKGSGFTRGVGAGSGAGSVRSVTSGRDAPVPGWLHTPRLCTPLPPTLPPSSQTRSWAAGGALGGGWGGGFCRGYRAGINISQKGRRGGSPAPLRPTQVSPSWNLSREFLCHQLLGPLYT